VDVDKVLIMILREHASEDYRRQKFLIRVFQAGDVDEDGELSIEEFSAIVRSVDDSTSHTLVDIVEMYRYAIEQSNWGRDGITSGGFVKMAKAFGLYDNVWKTAFSIQNVANGFEELKFMWREGSAWQFFVGTVLHALKALPRGHPTLHFSGAGDDSLPSLCHRYIIWRNKVDPPA
jgi:hypothetical protein